MNILQSHEFLSNTTSGQDNNQKVYQDKVLIKGPVFSLRNRNIAIKYCKGYTQGFCILVENQSYFQSWEEDNNSHSSQQEKKTNKERRSKSKNSNTLELNNTATNTIKKTFSHELSEFAKTQLLEYLGPIATIVHKKAIAKHSDATDKELINLLSKKIPSHEDAQKFRESLLEFIQNNL